MKTLIILLSLLFVFSASAMEMDTAAPEKKDVPESQYRCPVSQISNNEQCMTCHQMVMDNGKPIFGLKEIPLEASYSEKPPGVEIIQEFIGGPPVIYVEITQTGAFKFRDITDYLSWHPEIKKVIAELHTGGGSIMDAWRSVGIIREMQSRGVHVEMRVYGLAASAGVILLVAGDTRLVSNNAEIMIHKIWTFTMFDVKTPDSSQDQADVLKHFQDNINQFLRDRTDLTDDQLDNKIFKKDWWMTGKMAIELGIATGSIE